MIREEKEGGEKYLTVETEDDISRGAQGRLPIMANNQDRSERYVRQVADEIMEQIKAGVAPWQEP